MTDAGHARAGVNSSKDVGYRRSRIAAERLCNVGGLVPDLTVGKALRRLPFGPERGIYLQAEAALLTGLPKTTIRRWIQLERSAADIKAVVE